MSKISHLAINEEGFVFDPLTGESFTVNETGNFILNALKSNHESNEIVANLIEKFDVDADAAQRDVSDFISHLRTLRLM